MSFLCLFDVCLNHPGWDNALVVSNPMPECPPVTTAVFPRRLIPETISAAVVCGPNPDMIRFCSVFIF